MARAEIGDQVTFQTLAGPTPAIVLTKQASNLATLYVLAPTGPDDDYLVGPSTGYTTNPNSVTINDTQNPGTAAVTGSALLAQSLRDGTFIFPCTGFQTSSWARENPVSLQFSTNTPNEDLWLQFSTTTDITEIDASVQHDINSSMRVEVYRTNSAGVVTGPDATYADTVVTSWGWNSGTTSNPQTHTFNIGTVYPGPLSPRLYTVRYISGPNYPGPQTFYARNTLCRADEITV